MKFTIHSGALAESIAAAISSVPSRPPNPVMAGVLIEARQTGVTLSSFNYDRATTRVAAADVAEPDDAVVAGRLLALVGSNLPKNAESTISIVDNEMVIAAGRTEFRLPLMHRPDYPDLPALDASSRIGAVAAEEFAAAVRIVGGLASTDEKTLNLTALNVVAEPGSLTLTATDRYVVGRRRLDWHGADSAVMNVPALDLVATIKAVTGAGAEDIEILWDGALLGLRTSTATVITRSLAVDFPDMDAVINRTRSEPYQTAVTVQTADLSSMLRRAAAIADDKNDQIDLIAGDDALAITTTHSDTGKIADSITAAHLGGHRRLALNSKRLMNVLSIVDEPEVTLAFQNESRAASIAHMLSIFPGRIDELSAPDTASSALLIGIRK